MPKRPGNPDISTTAFSISRQFTGPPFSHALESAALRMKLLQEMVHSQEKTSPVVPPKTAKSAKAKKSAGKKSSAKAGKSKHKE